MAVKIAETNELKPGTIPKREKGEYLAQNLPVKAGNIMPQSYGELREYGQMMSTGDLALPEHFRNNPGLCIAIIKKAMKWEMDEWEVANQTYAVNNRLAYQAQLLAAVVKKWAPIKEKVIVPTYTGEGETRQCSFTLHHVETGELIEYTSPKIGKDLGKPADDGSKTKSPPVDYDGIWPKNSPLWRHEPDQQLYYYSIRAMARRHFPDILMGAYDREEVLAMKEMKDITPIRTDGKKVQNSLIDDDEPAQILTGELLEPDQEQEHTLADTYAETHVDPAKPGADKTVIVTKEDDEITDVEVQEPEPEVEETVITPDMIAENLIKSINGWSVLKDLEDWQKQELETIKALPKELASKVRKAYSSKYIDLDGGM